MSKKGDTSDDHPIGGALKKAAAKGSASAAAAGPSRPPPILVNCWDKQFPAPCPRHIGMGWHNCLEKGNGVSEADLAMLDELWSKGFLISLCEFVSKEWRERWYDQVFALPFRRQFKGVHDTTERCGPRGKAMLYKEHGVKIAIDSSEQVMQECFEKGMVIYPVVTPFSKHDWYRAQGSVPYNSFEEACKAVMKDNSLEEES